jgi:enamine deaminase RidA (YjgF/YER057c/UK114 family)
MTFIAENLKNAGVTLPEAAAPAANYLPYTISNNQLFVSGQLPMEDGKPAVIGTLGDDVSPEDGQRAARLCAINILAQAQTALGDLSRIKRVVKINGFVNSTPDFGDQPAVINGASDFLVEILGDAGKHSRAAVGMSSLPFGVAVEIDAIIEFE